MIKFTSGVMKVTAQKPYSLMNPAPLDHLQLPEEDEEVPD